MHATFNEPLPFMPPDPGAYDAKKAPRGRVLGRTIHLEHTQQFVAYLGLGSRAAEGYIDAEGGTVGSYDGFKVTPVGRDEKGVLWVKMEVNNVSNWTSALRVPSTNVGVPSAPRSHLLPGGECTQVFYWYEPIPNE